MEDYKVQLDIFEGPLDLLLHLIKINEMDIQEVRLAKITSQYLAYLRLLESLDLEVAGDFLVMAATLLNIKLRSLLPAPAEEEEEEEEVEDIMTARALMEKLVEYRKFKEAAAELRERELDRAGIFMREIALPKMARAEDAEMNADLDSLLVAFSRVLRFVDESQWHLVTEEEFSVEEKMDALERRLAAEPRLAVEEVFRECGSKLEMIVCLLAMLELSHLKAVRIEQHESHGPIYLFRIEDASRESEPGAAAETRPAAEVVQVGAGAPPEEA